ncbi:helix-turn-helix domain-containing protein [Cohnella nanjingensis]|uniref:Helix-turn-helix transcriptional regulator n=1 Tax=Cohnella nanjingensis TaxID=1387779 RepID=A0A7X0RTJ3_9BACL|nr:AraC family transcriptional regulator [Cohnella nanjingensis]MBB6673443.1 helix-turn-helix transcriptional regulator [Cohnella nanjingensis]
MRNIADFIARHPVVPFIRECDFAIRAPWSMPERRLLDYLLIYIQNGRCRFWVDGTPYLFEQGEFCLIQPNSLTVLEGLGNTVTPFAHFDLFYNPEREKSFPTRAGQTVLSAYLNLLQPRLNDLLGIDIPCRLRLRYPSKFRDTFLQVVEYWQYRDPVAQLRAQAGMTELSILLLEDYLTDRPSQSISQQTLNWITSYFSLHLDQEVRIEDMARRANLSPSRFNAVFKEQYGVTPHQYLLDMRISHARELLQNTDLSQEQIAAYCGFADVHHFSKSFRKKMGLPPGRYRSEQRRVTLG